jgi:PAS domain S-box-containing protein
MFQEWFKKKTLTLATYLLSTIIVVNTILVLYLSKRTGDYEAATARTEMVRGYANSLRAATVHADLAAREAVALNNEHSNTQYEEAIGNLERSFDSLKYNLKRASFDEALVGRISMNMTGTIEAYEHFLELIQANDSARIMTNFGQLLPSFDETDQQLNYLGEYSQKETGRASLVGGIGTIRFLQLVVLLAGVPVLLILLMQLRKSRKKLLGLNQEIDESNRKYVFNTMEDVDLENEQEIKTRLLDNLKQATEFIQQVSNGNYAIRWEGINDKNRSANRENIAGELIRMREQMKEVKEKDEIRMWTTEGLSKFGEIIRRNQDNFEVLGDNFVSNMVTYMNAKVGALFILEDEDETPYLELKACYAYERKKYINKRIALGEGLVGQTFLERKTVYLTEVPKEYMMITSSLGEVNPRCLVIVPLVTNEKVEGIMELASLIEIKPYQIEFLEKIGETLASSVVSVRSTEKTRELLEASQQQSEEVRAQEEEMRQNMEELEATQEQMSRQVNELNALKEKLEEEKSLFSALMDNIPEAIYFKDLESKFIRVSRHLADHFGKEVIDLIGKSDFDFQDEVHAREALEDEKTIMRTRQAKVDFVEKEILNDGSEHYVSTTKLPLLNSQGQITGTFGISRDISKFKQIEQDLQKKEKLVGELEQQNKRKIRQLEEALSEAEEKLEKRTRK